MANYQFLKDDKPVSLADVDDKLCADNEIPPHETDFCLPYQWLVEAGFAVCMRTNNTLITPEVISQYLALKEKDSPEGVNAAFVEFIEKNAPYLDGTIYQFTMWR